MGKAVFSLSKGDVSPVVRTSYGYHIFQILNKRHEGTISLPEAVKEIESKLYYQKEAIFYRKWLKDLRVRFPVKVDQELLQTLEFG